MNTNASTRTVLVVDDNFFARESLAVLLRILGFRTAVAGDGAAALDYLRGHPPPCLIVLDLWMPGMSGREFLQVKAADPALSAIPVFVLSAVADLEADLLRDAAQWIETKPLRVDRLLEILECCKPADEA
jgi:CheY-like chemotaxis protein